MEVQDSETHESSTREVLACLGVASRFRLVKELAESERCVGELAVAVGLSQSCTTRHLQVLERLGVVEGCREGKRVRFRLRGEAPRVGELLGWALTRPAANPAATEVNPGLDQPGTGGGERRARAPRAVPGRRWGGADAGPNTDAPARSEVARGLGGPQVENESADERSGGAGRFTGAQARRGDLDDYLL
jgi:DNA-binding transcriptional ArsR family regulator